MLLGTIHCGFTSMRLIQLVSIGVLKLISPQHTFIVCDFFHRQNAYNSNEGIFTTIYLLCKSVLGIPRKRHRHRSILHNILNRSDLVKFGLSNSFNNLPTKRPLGRVVCQNSATLSFKIMADGSKIEFFGPGVILFEIHTIV